MESRRQHDADCKTSDGAHQTHNSIEIRHQDRQHDKRDDARDAHRELEDAAREAGEARGGVFGRERAGVEAEEELEGADDGAGVEGHFGQGDDGDADDDQQREPLRGAGGEENVAGDFVLDAVAVHEQADAGHEQVEREGEGVGDVDAAAVFVRVAHVAVDVGEDAVAAPGRHEETKGERQRAPVCREEMLRCGLPERAR